MSFFSVEVGKFMYFMYASKIEGEILLRCHSEEAFFADEESLSCEMPRFFIPQKTWDSE